MRRFNDAFQRRFGRAPSQIRRLRPDGADALELKLSFRPPFDWQSLMQFYKDHPIPGVESFSDNCFQRVFRIGNVVGCFQAQMAAREAHVKLRVVTPDPRILFELVSRVRRMFDLDSDPMLVAQSFEKIPLLSHLCRRFPGLRLPGGWDPFETAVCSILGQLVSAGQRSNLTAQLIAAYGEEFAHPLTGEKICLFPGPEKLAESDLARVKTTPGRREAIREFSRRVLSGAILLSEAQDPSSFRKALLAINGIGPWSAECISLRAIGDTDAFPRTDLILKRVLDLYPALDLQAVKPWRSYAALYFWKEFAQTLSQRKRSQYRAVVLQGDVVTRRNDQAGRQRQRAGRNTLGDGTVQPANARRRQARTVSPDLMRSRAGTE
jgi:AraC family transcriptional regulator of adaptative response / DNA-3-methyladenine glycosylase II